MPRRLGDARLCCSGFSKPPQLFPHLVLQISTQKFTIPLLFNLVVFDSIVPSVDSTLVSHSPELGMSSGKLGVNQGDAPPCSRSLAPAAF